VWIPKTLTKLRRRVELNARRWKFREPCHDRL
jgi:hypothetical protein